MRASIFFLLAAFSTFCFADEVDEIIRPLGASKEDLKNIWHDGYCDPSWSVQVSREMLNDKNLLGYKGLVSGFFIKKDAGNMVVIMPGVKCDALNKYYFQGAASVEIKDFINRDLGFIGKYGHSVIDAIYIENIKFYSFNGNVGKFRLEYAKELAKKGLFTIEQKTSKFNEKPSIAFKGEITPAGIQFHDDVFR
jgi:hypothetical protein